MGLQNDGIQTPTDRTANLVEPVLITYNRAASLEKTLLAFSSRHEWLNRVFHVLDNASTDDTAQVVAAIQKRWPGLQYHRNACNIGGNANILRSVEIAHSEYHWVIGDDDSWIFDGAEELDRILVEGTADFIRLGWLVDDASRGKIIPARELALNERLFFSSLSMISATIVRRSVVLEALPHAYHNISNAFPQLVPVLCAIESKTIQVHTLHKNYMMHTPSAEPGYFFGDLELYAAWFRTSRFLVDEVLRAKFIAEFCHLMTRNRKGLFKEITWLTKVVLNAKAMGIPQTQYLLAMLGDGKGSRGRVLLAAFIYFLMPDFVAAGLRRFYRRIAGLPSSNLGFDRTRL